MILLLAPFLIPGFFLEAHFFLLQSELLVYMEQLQQNDTQ